jgi:hypothetical protein
VEQVAGNLLGHEHLEAEGGELRLRFELRRRVALRDAVLRVRAGLDPGEEAGRSRAERGMASWPDDPEQPPFC